MYEYIVSDVIKIVDGDTVDLKIDLGFNIFTVQRIRLAGIDAPELKGLTEEERKHATEAKNFVVNYFEEAKTNGYQIYVKTTLDDKYGRMLGRIHCNNKCLNDLMISNKMAVPYTGGTKKPYTPTN
jgi:micrococcal nuclease